MAEYATTIKYGDRSFYLSISGEDVYFSSSNKTGGLTLKGIKHKNNQMIDTSTGKPATNYQLGQALARSMK